MASSYALPAPVSVPRSLVLPRFADIVDCLIRGGTLLNVGSLAILLTLRCLGLLTSDAVTLLPAMACVGMAGVSLGMVLVCLRVLRTS